MAEWLALPEEILVQILEYLSARDILSCATTCKQISALVQGSTHLQLIIELAVHGLRLRLYPGAEPPNYRYRSAIEKLEAFRRTRKAWERLDPIKTAHIETEISEYELSEGTLGHGLRDEHSMFRGIELFQLYMEKGVGDCTVWKKHDDVGFHVQDFSFDHAEDLLVLVIAPPFQLSPDVITKRVCLRTLSGNLVHPSAQKAILTSPGEEEWVQCEIRVCGSILAIHFSHPSNFSPHLGRLTIWNWKTSDIISTCTGVGGYCFLSHDVALIIAQQPLTSASYRNEPAIYKAEIQTIGMGNESVGKVRFELPLSTSPSQVKVTAARPPTEKQDADKSYYTSPYIHDEAAERVVVIDISGERLFISGQRLLHLINNSTASLASSVSSSERYYRWSEWGPDTTFWLDSRYLVSSWVSVDGGRFVALSPYSRLFLTDLDGYVVSTRLNTASNSTTYTRLIILDFNRRLMQRDSARNQSPRRTKSIEWRKKSPIFDREIVSRLPFRVFQGQVPGTPLELMVGMDHLVVTMTSGYDVLQFTD